MLQNTGKRSDTHTQQETCQQFYYASSKTRTVYLCLIVNIHNIDRSVAVANEKKSVFFRLQDLQQVNIGTTINKNKIFELQTEVTKKKRKKIFISISSKQKTENTFTKLQSTHHCQNQYLLPVIWCLREHKKV